MISARRRIETALPPSFMHRICEALLEKGDPRTDYKLLEHCKGEFWSTTQESWAGYAKHEIWAAETRLWELRREALGPFVHRQIAFVYVVVVRWLEAITAAGLVTIVPGRFTAALEQLHEAIQREESNCELLDDLDRSGTKEARRMHRRITEFRKLGYYPGKDPFDG
ncbi:MAG TPA: hypothetical protein VN838_06805 [Bradyrhizobium sp.]|nr:hypothetical protein [Bradyrhizobium sp.]